MARVADWICDRLSEEGVKHIFMLPGGGAMYLNDAVATRADIAGISCHHEQACGIAAEAYGRTSNLTNPGFGVAMVTTGPGATNVITPVAGAWIDSVPMLVLSGQAKRQDLVGDRSIRQGGVQEVDIVNIVQSITKYAVCITDPADIPMHWEQALFLMRSGRPGPVWLDIPLDIQAMSIESAVPPKKVLQFDTRESTADMAEILKAIDNAKRPLILAGHGVRLAGAAANFRSMVEKLDIPVTMTWNALDLLPFDHELNMGRPGVVASRASNFAVQNCDLLLVIGARLDNVVTAYNPGGFARAAKKIVVDIDAEELSNKQCMGIDQPVVMDAADFIKEILGSATKTENPQWKSKCADWKERYLASDRKNFPESGPISHAHFVSKLSDALPEGALITAGSSGLAVEFFFAGFRNKPGQRTFLTSGLGAMGYGLPAAIGACVGNDKKPMIALESDGSLQLNLQELATLVSQALPVCIFVMNNEGYASIRNTQRNHFASRYLGSGPESGLYIPDLERIAFAYNLPYLSIDQSEKLADTLDAALELPRPCLVDVRLLPDESLEPKCATILSDDGTIISMPLEDMTPLLSLEELQGEMIIDVTEESIRARAQV